MPTFRTRARAAGGVAQIASIVLKSNEDILKQLDGEQKAQEQFTKMVKRGAEYAQRTAPLGETGNLRSSIRAEPLTTDSQGILTGKITVGNGIAPYWSFVEYGTGTRGASSEQPPPGLPASYRHGVGAGMEAQPFMRPTILWLKAVL